MIGMTQTKLYYDWRNNYKYIFSEWHEQSNQMSYEGQLES